MKLENIISGICKIFYVLIDVIDVLIDVVGGGVYKIVSDLVNVIRNVDLSNKNLKRIPKKVGMPFKGHPNKITSLEGCPEIIGGNFNCGYNQLKSLEEIPEKK